MPVRRVLANDAVEADRGRVALQRGPIVYAAEWPDNPNGAVRNIVLPDDAAAHERIPLRSAPRGPGNHRDAPLASPTMRVAASTKTAQNFMAIPYATWANRGRGQMIVWLATRDEVARPTPWPTAATTSAVTTSPARRHPRAINDGEDPRASDDPTSYFDWWPRRGTDRMGRIRVSETVPHLAPRGLLVR